MDHIQEDPNEAAATLQPLLVVAMKNDSPEVLLVKSSVPIHNPAAANAEQVTFVLLPTELYYLQSIYYFDLGQVSDKSFFLDVDLLSLQNWGSELMLLILSTIMGSL